MKFDTRKDLPVPDTPESAVFLHKNNVVTPSDGDTSDAARQHVNLVDVFITPVITSRRIRDKGRCLLTNESVDDLTRALEDLMISSSSTSSTSSTSTSSSDSEKDVESEKELKKPAVAKKQKKKISLCKLVAETPEAKDPALGRCQQEMVDIETMNIVQVKRSLRLVKQGS